MEPDAIFFGAPADCSVIVLSASLLLLAPVAVRAVTELIQFVKRWRARRALEQQHAALRSAGGRKLRTPPKRGGGVRSPRSPGGRRGRGRGYGLRPQDLEESDADSMLSAKRAASGAAHDDAAASPVADERPDPAALSSVDGLLASPAFKRHVARGGVDVSRAERQMQAYKMLREADPSGFKQLMHVEGLSDWVSSTPTRGQLALEYACTTGLYTAGLLVYLYYAGRGYMPPWAALVVRCVACWAGANVLGWQLAATSAPGAVLRSCWEHEVWCTPASWWQLWLLHALEVTYCTITLGAGVLVSMALRCFGRTRQTAGERLLGLRFVRETGRSILEATPA